MGCVAPSVSHSAVSNAPNERILEKTKAGQQLAAAQGKHIGRPKGLDAENLAKVRKALEKGLSGAETVELSGSSLSGVKRYRKHLRATPPRHLLGLVREHGLHKSGQAGWLAAQ